MRKLDNDDDDDTQVYKRPWIRLTDEEIALIKANYPHFQGFVRAIEAKLREKNA